MRTHQYISWPGIKSDNGKVVSKCEKCQLTQRNQERQIVELISQSNQWKYILGFDLCELYHQQHLAYTDYFASYPFILKLGHITRSNVIEQLEGLSSHISTKGVLMSNCLCI